jgi:gamma-glutamylcyclotransferase
MSQWYFAYGSNLFVPQMLHRIGSTGDVDHPPRVVRLPGHRLIFQEVESDGPAYANIVIPGPGVLGVIYRFSEADFERLDTFETGYVRHGVSVVDMQGEPIEAIAYLVESRPGLREARPSAEYLARIVDGARHHGLPESYVNCIVAIAESDTFRMD